MVEVIEGLVAEVRALRIEVGEQRIKPLLMKVGRVAEELSMGETTVKQMLRTGELSSLKRGRSRFVSLVEVERWISTNTGRKDLRQAKTRRKTESEKIRAALKKR